MGLGLALGLGAMGAPARRAVVLTPLVVEARHAHEGFAVRVHLRRIRGCPGLLWAPG